ncbi:MAG TPA: hypothetical protein VIM73_12005 [Polyangiaceae bacterium]
MRGSSSACRKSLARWTHRYRWAAAVLLLATLLTPRDGAAAPLVEAPATCGSSAEFEHELAVRLAPGVETPPTQVHIEAIESGYRLRMRVAGEERELVDPSCRELFRAAVVIAVAQSKQRASNRAAPGKGERAPLVVGATGQAPPGAADDETSSPSRWHLRAAAGSGVSLGLTPRPVLGLDVEANARTSGLGVAVVGRWLAESSERDRRDRGVDVWAVGGELLGLFQPVPLLQLRAGLAAYALRGNGVGSAADASGWAWAAGPAAGFLLTPALPGQIWAGVGGTAQLNVIRATFQIDNYGEVYAVPRVSGVLFLRLGWEFF